MVLSIPWDDTLSLLGPLPTLPRAIATSDVPSEDRAASRDENPSSFAGLQTFSRIALLKSCSNYKEVQSLIIPS